MSESVNLSFCRFATNGCERWGLMHKKETGQNNRCFINDNLPVASGDRINGSRWIIQAHRAGGVFQHYGLPVWSLLRNVEDQINQDPSWNCHSLLALDCDCQDGTLGILIILFHFSREFYLHNFT